MPDFGQEQALNFQIPGQGNYTTQPVPQNPNTQGMQDSVGEALSGLQYVQGATEDYYKKWAMLKSFAHEAAQNMDIDVTRPDYSKPESVKLNQIYTKAIADLKYQGDLLKNSQSMLMKDREQGNIPNRDLSQRPFATGQPYEDTMPNELDPITIAANQELSKPHYGSSINQGLQLYEEKKQLFRSLAEKQPARADYWKRQEQGLVKPLQAEREFAPYHDRNESRDRRRIARAGDEFKNLVHLVTNRGAGYTPSPTELTANGTPYLVNPRGAGDSYGGGRIVEWRVDPDTDKTELVISQGQGDKESQKVIPIDRGDIMGVMREYAASNQAKYGYNADDVEDYIHEIRPDWINDRGEAQVNNIVTKDSENISKSNMDAAKGMKTIIEPKVKALEDRLKTLKTGFFYNDRDKVTLPNGTPVDIKVVKDGESFEIMNIKDLAPEDEFQSKAAADLYYKGKKEMSLQQLAKFLVEQGAHLTQSNSLIAPKQAPNKQDTNKIDVLP